MPGLIKVNPALDMEETLRFGLWLFGGDFVHAGSREFVAGCGIPVLVMPGHETAHPTSIAEEILKFAPKAEYQKFWRDEGRDYSVPVIRDFFKRHVPA